MILKLSNLRNQSERRLQRALHVASSLLGWRVPDTVAEVRATSLENEDIDSPLPEELQDPFAVLDRDRQNFPPAPICGCDGPVTGEGPSLNLLAEKITNAE